MSNKISFQESQAFDIWWNVVQTKVHNNAKEKGWWDEERNDGEMIALMHSELSEALEALRKDGLIREDEYEAKRQEILRSM